MPETTTTTDLLTTTADPSSCCCGMTTTTRPPSFCKCEDPVTFDFRTNIIVPITLEINIPRGNSGFPSQNLFLKSYIHGCHSVHSAFCYDEDNTLRTSAHPNYWLATWNGGPTPDSHAYNAHFYIKEPANCNARPRVAFYVDTESAEGNIVQSTLRPLRISDYLFHIKDIYGYLPRFVRLERDGFDPRGWFERHNFSLNGSNGLFVCCSQGILQDILLHKFLDADEILDPVVVDVAEFVPHITLRFPILSGVIAKAWNRGEIDNSTLDNLTLYGPVILQVGIYWVFKASVKSVFGNLNLTYALSTTTIFVKTLQFPFSGGSVDLDYYSHGAGDIEDYYHRLRWNYKPLNLDARIRLPIIFPDILNAIENMRATLHFGEPIINSLHSEDGVIDWSRVDIWDPDPKHFSDYYKYYTYLDFFDYFGYFDYYAYGDFLVNVPFYC